MEKKTTSASTICILKSASAKCPERKVQLSIMKCLLHSTPHSSEKYRADNTLKNTRLETTLFCLRQVIHEYLSGLIYLLI